MHLGNCTQPHQSLFLFESVTLSGFELTDKVEKVAFANGEVVVHGHVDQKLRAPVFGVDGLRAEREDGSSRRGELQTSSRITPLLGSPVTWTKKAKLDDCKHIFTASRVSDNFRMKHISHESQKNV